MIYCAVGFRTVKDGITIGVGRGIAKMPLKFLYGSYNSVISCSEGDSAVITHMTYGLTEKQANERLDLLGWENYRNDIARKSVINPACNIRAILVTRRKR